MADGRVIGCCRKAGLFVGLALTLFAATSAGAEVLNWEQCLTEAAEHNRDLRAAGHDVRSSDFQRRAAYSGFFPQFSLDAGLNRSSRGGGAGDFIFVPPEDGSPAGGNRLGGGEGTIRSAGVSATQNIFAGFSDVARVEQGEAALEASAAQQAAVRAQVSYDLKAAFSGLSYAQQFHRLAKDIVKRREENVRLVELRYQGGSENKGNLLFTQASLSQARFDRLQSGNSIRVAQQELARVLGREQADDLEVTGVLPVSEVQGRPDFIQLLSEVPEHRQARAEAAGAAAGVKLARSTLYPNLSAGGSLSRLDGGGAGLDDEQWRAGLTLSLPLFTGGRNYHNLRSAGEGQAAAEARLGATGQQVMVRLQQTFADYEQAVERVNVDREFLRAAAARAEIGRAKYGNGLLSFEDWDTIENDLITRQKNLLQSERGRIIAEAAWEQAQGKGAVP